eukprot:6185541-Pleurochrysis_carterae.AAC.1
MACVTLVLWCGAANEPASTRNVGAVVPLSKTRALVVTPPVSRVPASRRPRPRRAVTTIPYDRRALIRFRMRLYGTCTGPLAVNIP